MILELRERGVTCKALSFLTDSHDSTIRQLIPGKTKKRHTLQPRWRVGQAIIAAHKEFCGVKP